MDENILEKLEQFFSQYKSFHFKKKDTIINAQETPKGVYFIKSGNVRLYSISSEGQELTLNIFKPGSYFSMMWAIGDIPNDYYFQAMTPVEVWLAPKADLVGYLKKEPEVLFELTRRILIGLAGTLRSTELLLFGKASDKIYAVLVTLAKRFGQPGKNKETVIQLPLTHQDIANLTGLTRETVSLEIKRLERKGTIGYQKKLIFVKISP